MQVSISTPIKRATRRRGPSKPTLAATAASLRTTLAMRLDVLAGCELQHGHHLAAEHLTRRAAALREAGASA